MKQTTKRNVKHFGLALRVRRALCTSLALAIETLIVCLPGCPTPIHAETASNAADVQCTPQSTNLRFGQLNQQRPLLVTGEGEIVLVCQNLSHEVRSVELGLGLPTMGRRAAALQSGHGALAASFFLDGQYTQPWGDDTNGASAWHGLIMLNPAERRLLRLPIYAQLQNRRDARAGVYQANVPLQLTTAPR